MLGSCRWWLDEEDVPRENGTHPAYGRRRVCFDIMNTRSQETEPGSEMAENAVGGTPSAATGTVALPERRQEAVLKQGFCRLATACYRIKKDFYRMLPHITASCRITFFCGPSFAQQVMDGRQARLGSSMESGRTTGTQWHRGGAVREKSGAGRGSSADFGGKKCGFLRIFPRFSTILRTEQGRICAILRIFTGETLFLIRKPENEDDRNGKNRRINQRWQVMLCGVTGRSNLHKIAMVRILWI